MKNKTSAIIISSALISSFLFTGVAFAQTATPTQSRGGYGGGHMRRAPGVFGTVTAVSGNTLTITSNGFGPNTTATTYTVDAASATVEKDGASSSVSAIVVGDKVSVQGAVSGTNVTATSIRDGMGGGMGQGRGVFGTVASVSGNTVTITSKGFGQQTTATTYTVDATNATVTKGGTAATVSSIAVGDTVMVQGTVTGTNVVATAINDGVGGPMGGRGGRGMHGASMNSSTTAMATLQGNGQPIVGGTITAMSGSIVTVTNASNVTYTIDTTNAKLTKNGTTAQLSDLSVGDKVIAQGTISGNAVTAASVIDQGQTSAPITNAQGIAPTPPQHRGFFGMIGGFFGHLFGF